MNTAKEPRFYTLQSAVTEVEEIITQAFASKLNPDVHGTIKVHIYVWMGKPPDPAVSVRVGEVSVRWAGPGNTTQGVSWLAHEAPGVVLWAERAILYRLICDEDQDLADTWLAEEVGAT